MKTLVIVDNFVDYLKDEKYFKIDDNNYLTLYDPGLVLPNELFLVLLPGFDYRRLVQFIGDTDKDLTVFIQDHTRGLLVFCNLFQSVITQKTYADNGVRELSLKERLLIDLKGEL
jgi:hypothetical protein